MFFRFSHIKRFSKTKLIALKSYPKHAKGQHFRETETHLPYLGDGRWIPLPEFQLLHFPYRNWATKIPLPKFEVPKLFYQNVELPNFPTGS